MRLTSLIALSTILIATLHGNLGISKDVSSGSAIKSHNEMLISLFGQDELPDETKVNPFISSIGPEENYWPAIYLGALRSAYKENAESAITLNALAHVGRTLGSAPPVIMTLGVKDDNFFQGELEKIPLQVLQIEEPEYRVYGLVTPSAKLIAYSILTRRDKLGAAEKKRFLGEAIIDFSASGMQGSPLAAGIYVGLKPSDSLFLPKLCDVIRRSNSGTLLLGDKCAAAEPLLGSTLQEENERQSEFRLRLRHLLGMKYEPYRQKLCGGEKLRLEEEYVCNDLLLVSLELCRITTNAPVYSPISGTFICDGRALGSISHIVKSLYSQIFNINENSFWKSR
jgi:hypothetical protein